MGKTCTCEVGGKLIEGLRVIKENPLTVIVEYKGRHIKRHREKHYVDINKCEFYPYEGAVCYCNSDISGPFVCTKEYSKKCEWAIQQRKEIEK